ncbi:hypothetical protein B0J18DRAFT_455850 [Chaetomium sp. MPI-SDFR-AT-0129]|nr:hypothetical protein B0J18DRAFT_455850 [Chaetomium sp. MPI-SDFR-AT-0129]
MAYQSIDICDAALSQGSRVGYSGWFVRDMTSHVYNVLATIEREQPAHGSGVAMSEKVPDIRLSNRRISNPDDEMWIAAAEGNLAVSLMASGRVEEFEIFVRLKQRLDMKANEDVYLRNTGLCLFLLGRFQEALPACREALNAARRKRGEFSEQIPTCYFDLGNIYIRVKNKPAVLDALQECLGRRKTPIPLHQFTTFTLHKIGDAAAMEGDYRESIPFYEQALDILSRCEWQPGSLCRTAFSLAKAYKRNENLALYEKYVQRGNAARLRIEEVSTQELGVVPEDYSIFAPVCLR